MTSIHALMTPAAARKFFSALANAIPGSKKLYLLPLSTRIDLQARQAALAVFETYRSTARKTHWSRWLPRLLVLKILELQYAGLRRRFDMNPTAVGLCWNGLDRSRLLFSIALKDAGRACLYAELAPLPGFLTLDAKGVNFLSSLSREADFYRVWLDQQPASEEWRGTGLRLSRRQVKRQRTVRPDKKELPNGPFIFVPLQVPGDSQIRYYGDWIASMEHLIETLQLASRQLPDGWHIRIKEHPSAKIDLSALITAQSDHKCWLDNETDTYEQVAQSAAILTVNSSVGLQGFFFDKPVIVLGQAFYGFEPLVQRATSPESLAAILSSPQQLPIDHNLRTAFMRYLMEVHFFPGSLSTVGEKLNPAQKAHLQKVMHDAALIAPSCTKPCGSAAQQPQHLE